MLHVAFVFLDGVGLGPGGSLNPLDTDEWTALARLAGGARWTEDAPSLDRPDHVFRAVDATLGMDGLPQSGTGQVALFAGVDAPRLAGRHWGPYPHSATVAALERHSLWQRLLDAGVPPERLCFANAYPDRFFAYAAETNRWSTTTRMARAADVRLRTEADVRAGEALTAEITGEAWRTALSLDVPLLDPRDAGRRFHALALAHTATLFEYYLTDKAGHGRDTDAARRVLATVDGFLGGYLERFDPGTDLLVVCSDHGNLEALDRKPHTRHPVPLVAFGRGASAFRDVHDLTAVTPALVEAVRYVTASAT